jgi:hypothetical protein
MMSRVVPAVVDVVRVAVELDDLFVFLDPVDPDVVFVFAARFAFEAGLRVVVAAVVVDLVVAVVVGVVAVVEPGVGVVAPVVPDGSATAGEEGAPAGAWSPPVSFTNENASSAPASTIIAPIATVGSRQLGVGASRVRAGAPHSRHQSCSGPIGDEQRGQRIEPGSGSGGRGPVALIAWIRCRAAPSDRTPSQAVVTRARGPDRLGRR